MVKKILVTTAVLGGLVLLVLGWDKTWSYVKGTRQAINDQVDDNTPLSLEKSRIDTMIQEEQKNIFGFEDKVAELEARRDSAVRLIADARKRLAGEMELLKRIKGMLDGGNTSYQIGHSQYTRAEVNADALERIEAVKRIQETIDFNDSLRLDLDKAINQGRGSLAEARKRVGELKNAIVRLDVRDANAEVRLEMARLTSAIAGAPLTTDSELEKAVRNYDRRVGQKERRAASTLAGNGNPFRIDYSSSVVTENASAEITRLVAASENSAKPAAVETLPPWGTAQRATEKPAEAKQD